MGLLKTKSTLTIAVWASVLIHTAGFLGFELAFSNNRESFPKSEPRTVTIVSISSVSDTVPPKENLIQDNMQNKVLENIPQEETRQEKLTSSLEIKSNNILDNKQVDEIPTFILPAISGQSAAAEETVLITEPIPLKSIEPEYPFRARKKGIEGVVVMDVIVSNKGEPLSCQIFDSSGNKDLDNAAKKSVLSSQFQPGTANGEDIETTLRINISFVLNKS